MADGALTDGTGISPLTPQKLFKDFMVDFLKTAAAVLVGGNITGVQAALDAPHTAVVAVAGALISAGYRAALRFFSS